MEVKINWIATIQAYITGIIIILIKLLYLDVLFFMFNNLVNLVTCTRTSSFGVVNRVSKTINQGPYVATMRKYTTTNYNKERKRVAEMLANDLKELFLHSLNKYPVLYVETNNFVYENVLLKLKSDGLIRFESGKKYKAPQIVEKIRIMNWGSVVRCFWNLKALKRVFRMETICKYRLERVDV